MSIASVLDYVLSACHAHDTSVSDRGHRHSCGSIEVSFYIRKRRPDENSIDIVVSEAPQPPTAEKLQNEADIDILCAILDANVEQEVQRLIQIRGEFANHAETVDRLAETVDTDIDEETSHIKHLVTKCKEYFQAQEERIEKLRQIRSRAAQGLLSSSQCVQEMQAMRNPLVELAAIWVPS